MTDDLLEVYKYSKKLMPLVHLPVQSGSNKILSLMNRKHNIEFYFDIFEKLKKINEKIEFSSDFIIGYPNEDEIDFADTIRLIKKIKFINSYSFIFSPRPGTVAAHLKSVDKLKSSNRLKIIQRELFLNQKNKNKSFENKIIDVLVENKAKNNGKFFGRNEYMTSVIFNGIENCVGKIVPVKILTSNQNTLIGNMIEKSNQKVA